MLTVESLSSPQGSNLVNNKLRWILEFFSFFKELYFNEIMSYFKIVIQCISKFQTSKSNVLSHAPIDNFAVPTECYAHKWIFIHIDHDACVIVCRREYKIFGTSACLDIIMFALQIFVGLVCITHCSVLVVNP